MTKEEEYNELRKEAAKIGMKCYNSFHFFFVTFWKEMSGDELVESPHIKYLCDEIQQHAMKVINGEFSMKTLIISIMPGASKSTIVTIALTSWVWLRAPWLASTNVSYSGRLSERHAKKARSITDSEKWHILFDDIFQIIHGKKFKITSQNQNEMVNNFKGERFNTSVDGTITGMHADFIFKDDMQDPKKAKSDTERVHTNEWDQETLSSRHKRADCFLDIIIAQRLHAEDLTGYTLNKDMDVTLIQLPAEITNASEVHPPEAISIYTDGILDPLRRPKHVLDGLKAQMTSGPYTCQYLQAPYNLEEQDIKPSFFEIIEQLPSNNISWDVWVDGAYTEKTENDPTGIMIAARVGNDFIVKEAYNVRKTLPDLVRFIKELSELGVFDKNKARIAIEPKASGYSLYQYIINDTDFNCTLIGQNNKLEAKLVQEGKTARHAIILPKAESHRIKLLKGKWNDEYIVQLCGFPRAAHDEMIDVTGYAINSYYHKENTFLEEWALNKLEKNLIGSIMVNLTSQQVPAKNGKPIMAVDYHENDSGDIQMFDIPNNRYHNRYLCVVVMKSEAERGGTTCIIILDRLSCTVAAMYDIDLINPRQIANKALELSYLYDKARLVVAVKKTISTQNEELDLGHMIIQEIRKVGYDNLFSRLAQNDIRKRRERIYGFEVNRSTSREIYLHLKDQAETNKIDELPIEVFEDISVLERKKETGEIDGQDGKEVNRGLAYSIALKVHDEWQDVPKLKNRLGDKWN